MVSKSVCDDVIEGMDLARRGAAFLYHHGAAKVWVFGSVAKGRPLDFRSDIDFAVEGFPSEKLWRAGAELEQLLNFSGFVLFSRHSSLVTLLLPLLPCLCACASNSAWPGGGRVARRIFKLRRPQN